MSVRGRAWKVLAAAILGCTAAQGGTLPPGFADTLVASVESPTALAFTPDGRLLIATQPGSVRVVQGGALLPEPALDLGSAHVCSNRDRGLLGLAVDPEFEQNRFVYLGYVFNKHGACPQDRPSDPKNPVTRVSRFVLGQDNTIALQSETVLLDNIPSPKGIHDAGDLDFGKDGMLYVSLGDGGSDYAGGGNGAFNDAARDPNVLLGKVLRITRDGLAPGDNPFHGAGTARCATSGSISQNLHCRETFASGFRNPFRFAMDPDANDVRMFINDVGQISWEEIDEAIAGADYGWNCREAAHVNSTSGPCNPAPAGMTDPIFEYSHTQVVADRVRDCGAVTGAAFVPRGLWPGRDGDYLFSDYLCGAIFSLKQTAGRWSAERFAKDLGDESAVDLVFGPGGLYYTTYASGGQIRRIGHEGGAVLALEPPMSWLFTLAAVAGLLLAWKRIRPRTARVRTAARERRASATAGAAHRVGSRRRA